MKSSVCSEMISPFQRKLFMMFTAVFCVEILYRVQNFDTNGLSIQDTNDTNITSKLACLFVSLLCSLHVFIGFTEKCMMSGKSKRKGSSK